MRKFFFVPLACAGLFLSFNTIKKPVADPPAKQQSSITSGNKKGWISLFNQKDINDWFVKIAHHEVGENYGNTFRVEDGMVKVRYDQYGDFNDQFGHLYYKVPYSYYHLVVEYRFVGKLQKAPLIIR